MKRYSGLFEQVVSFENMLAGARNAIRGKKSKASVAYFNFHLEQGILYLQRRLISGEYRPNPYHQFKIYEPKERVICSSDFQDRVVHHAVCNVLDPVLEARLIFDTYACLVGKGTHGAVKRAQFFSRKYNFYLKCDIRKFFESIDHEVLKSLMKKIIKDKKMLSLLDIIIDHKVPGNPLGKGLPIGNLTSQHFANYYLGQLDHFLKDHLRVPAYIRYMDDFIVFSNNKKDLHKVLVKVREFVGERLKLELKEKVTQIAPVSEGVPFLGFRIYKNLIRIKRENLVRFRRKIKEKEKAYDNGKISEKELIQSVSSMVAHLNQANSTAVRRKDLYSSIFMA